jgi:hypothetical protein
MGVLEGGQLGGNEVSEWFRLGFWGRLVRRGLKRKEDWEMEEMPTRFAEESPGNSPFNPKAVFPSRGFRHRDHNNKQLISLCDFQHFYFSSNKTSDYKNKERRNLNDRG